MKTTAFLSMIMDEAPDWGEPQILSYMNEAQRMILNHNLPDMFYLDETTGKPPVVTAVASQLKYYVGIDTGFTYDAWKIYGIVSAGSDETGVITPSVQFFQDTGDGASVQFSEEQVADFAVLAYRQPKEITSVRINLEVPAKYHLPLLKRIVMMLLEEAENGAPSQDRPLIERVALPKAWNEMCQQEFRGNNISEGYDG